MNKLTLIVDGNWLFMTRIFTCSKELKADLPQGYAHVQTGFLAAIQQLLSSIPEIDNWIVVSDGGSWRKNLPIPECVSVTYKGNRVPDETYNWKKIWDVWEEFKKSLSEQGVTIAQAPSIEGDDWCAYWAGKLRRQGVSSIIWTKDHDLMQLVKESNGAWTGWYNDVDGLYLNESQQPENQFFTPITPGAMLLDSLRRRIKKISYINPMTQVIVEKVFNGDVSDNIKPILYCVKNSRTYKLPKKEIPYEIDLYDDDQVNSFIREKLKESKYSSLKFSDVRSHFEYNRQLVVLNSVHYPDEVKKLLLENGREYALAPEEVKAVAADPEPMASGTSFNDLIDLL